MAGRGEIHIDLGEKPKDEVDGIVHDAACLKLRLLEGQAAAWVCVDTCALRDRALRVVSHDQMRMIRESMEGDDGQ